MAGRRYRQAACIDLRQVPKFVVDRSSSCDDLTSSKAAPLAGTDDASGPFVSPDGRCLGFFARGKLKKLRVTGPFKDDRKYV